MTELELILQTVSQLGEAGKEAFLWWLIMDKVVPGVLFGGFVIFVVIYGLRFARTVMGDSTTLKTLRKRLELDHQYRFDEVTEGDRIRILNRVEELLAQARKQDATVEPAPPPKAAPPKAP